MTRFHINKHGVPAICKAKIGNCPLGGNELHFDSLSEAQVYIDNKNIGKHGLLPQMKYKLIMEEVRHEKKSYVAYLNSEYFDEEPMLSFNEITEKSEIFDERYHPKKAIIGQFTHMQKTYEDSKEMKDFTIMENNWIDKLNELFEEKYGIKPNDYNLPEELATIYETEYKVAQNINMYYHNGLEKVTAIFNNILQEDWTYMYNNQSDGVIDILIHVRKNLLDVKLI